MQNIGQLFGGHPQIANLFQNIPLLAQGMVERNGGVNNFDPNRLLGFLSTNSFSDTVASLASSVQAGTSMETIVETMMDKVYNEAVVPSPAIRLLESDKPWTLDLPTNISYREKDLFRISFNDEIYVIPKAIGKVLMLFALLDDSGVLEEENFKKKNAAEAPNSNTSDILDNNLEEVKEGNSKTSGILENTLEEVNADTSDILEEVKEGNSKSSGILESNSDILGTKENKESIPTFEFDFHGHNPQIINELWAYALGGDERSIAKSISSNKELIQTVKLMHYLSFEQKAIQNVCLTYLKKSTQSDFVEWVADLENEQSWYTVLSHFPSKIYQHIFNNKDFYIFECNPNSRKLLEHIIQRYFDSKDFKTLTPAEKSLERVFEFFGVIANYVKVTEEYVYFNDRRYKRHNATCYMWTVIGIVIDYILGENNSDLDYEYVEPERPCAISLVNIVSDFQFDLVKNAQQDVDKEDSSELSTWSSEFTTEPSSDDEWHR